MGRYTGPAAGSAAAKEPSCSSRARSASPRSARSSVVRTRPASTDRRRRAAARRRSTRSSCARSRRSSASTGVSEKQFREHVREGQHAARHHGPQSSRRARELVSTTWCIAWASPRSRKAARQLIRHRHVEVNQKTRRHPELPGAAGPGDSRPHEVARAGRRCRRRWIRRRAARRCRGSPWIARASAAVCWSVRRARTSRSPRRSSW